jgi:LmbE family N-acetylglucosaminyl deacetylase
MSELDKILVVVAHPDDEILGMGGLFSHFKDSCDVRIVFLAEGSSARFSDRKRSSNEIAAAISKLKCEGYI